LLRSISVTRTGVVRSAAAQARPPKPAPTITTRGSPSSEKAGLPSSCGNRRRNPASTSPSTDPRPAPCSASSASTNIQYTVSVPCASSMRTPRSVTASATADTRTPAPSSSAAAPAAAAQWGKACADATGSHKEIVVP
jgi:hypothetical protein